jgi:hypothetical protein
MSVFRKLIAGKLTLSQGLRQGYQYYIAYKEEQGMKYLVSYCYFGNKPMGSSKSDFNEIMGKLDPLLKSKIDMEKMQAGAKYFFLPKDKTTFTLQLRENGQSFTNEVIPISTIETYEK